MIFMLLKIAGLDHLPAPLLSNWALEPSLIWQEGDMSPNGEHYTDAGFNLTMPNHDAWQDALVYLQEFMEDKSEMFHELIGMGADMELHVGTDIPQGETVSPPLEFPRYLLEELVMREISLSVIAFTGEDKT